MCGAARPGRWGLTELYEVGPLRLRERSLKTVHAYVSRGRLVRNAQRIRAACGPGVGLCAMVKANGYGQGARNVVTALAGQADWFAVANIEEAESIQPFLADKPVLTTCPVFAGEDGELLRLAQARGFHCTVCSGSALRYLLGVLAGRGAPLNLHVKVDTGMGRLGCTGEEGLALVQAIDAGAAVRLAGAYTHFATADEADASFAGEQLERFGRFLRASGLEGRVGVVRHAANTSGALRLPEARLDMVRCGIGLYGYVNFEGGQEQPGFEPVVRVEAPVVQVKRLRAGESCGYGRAYVAERERLIGVVPVGYADGLSRVLSNRAMMRCGEYGAPVVGRISMDLTIIDLTDVPGACEGMTVTVLDDRPDGACNAAGLARRAGTIPYEVLTSIGNRIKRVLVD